MKPERENLILADELVALVKRWIDGMDGDDAFAAMDARAFEIAKRRIALTKKETSL